jgi:hypothetical protein
MSPFEPADIRSLEDAFWTALADAGVRPRRRAMLSRLLSSPEFNAIRLAGRTRTRGRP